MRHLRQLTAPGPGLSEADAQARLLSEGHNELPRPNRRTPLRIILDVLREPMLAFLVIGGIVYLILGSLEEALILLAFALLSVVIIAVQEVRTEHVLEALRDLTSSRALVIRDGERKRIAGRDVVRAVRCRTGLFDSMTMVITSLQYACTNDWQTNVLRGPNFT